jgi:hypothetical protein
MNIILIQLRCNASFLNYDWCKLKKLNKIQMLPVTVAHHVKTLTISVLIVINIEIIGKYYLIVLIGYLLTLISIQIYWQKEVIS